MWFCCQLWHCTCLGQFDVWKAWSQVVHPTKAATPTSPTKFADSGSSDDVRPNVYLEDDDGEDQSCASPSTSSFEITATVSKALDVVNESPRSSGGCMALPIVSRSESPLSGSSHPGRAMSRNSSSSFGEGLDSEAAGDHGYEETLSVESRTERTELESRLHYWNREHNVCAREYEEETDESSRCPDFGSREEVNTDKCVESSEEEKGDETGEEKEVIKPQYRKIWELRATLEEDEELEHLVSPLPKPLNLYNPSPVQSPETETAYEHDDTLPRCRSSFSCWPSRASVPPLRLNRRPQHRGNQASPAEPDSEPQGAFELQASGNIEKELAATATVEESQASALHQLRAESACRSMDYSPVSNFSLSYFRTEGSHGADESSSQAGQGLPLVGDDDKEKGFVSSDTYEDTVVPVTSECGAMASRRGPDNDGSKSAPSPSEVRDQQPTTSGANAGDRGAATTRCKHLDIESSDDEAEGAAALRRPEGEASPTWDSRFRCSPSSGRHRALGLYRVMAAIANLEDDDHQLLSSQCSSGRSFRRDYSVDRKSDALFREFSQYEKGKGEIFPRRRRTGIRRHTTRTRNVAPNQPPSLPPKVSPRKFIKNDGNLTDVPPLGTKLLIPFPNEENVSECSSALAGEDNSSE